MLRDLKFVFRLFIKNGISSVMGVLIFGIGLAMSITMFALVSGILWSSPDINNKKDILHVEWKESPEIENFRERILAADYWFFKEQNNSFEHLLAYHTLPVSIYNPQSDVFSTRYSRALVPGNFFEVIKTKPLLGRTLTPKDMDRDNGRTILISYRVWQEQFGGDPNAVGSSTYISGQLQTVIGVMPEGFNFPANQDAWVAYDFSQANRTNHMARARLEVFGQLKQGVSIKQAEVELETLAARLANQYPQSNEYYLDLDIKSYNQEFASKQLTEILYILLFFSLLVLLIACANVSNLLLVRTSRRQHELAIRKALGASRNNLLSMVILDGLLLAVAGFLLSLLLYEWLEKLIWRVMEQNLSSMPYWWNISLNWQVYLFAIGILCLSVFASSLVPAIRVLKKQSNDILKDDTRTSSSTFIGRIAKVLVGSQVVFSTVLLIAALLMALVSQYLANRHIPYDPKQLLTTRLQLNATGEFSEVEAAHEFYDSITEQMLAIPGVERVGFSYSFGGVEPSRRQFEIEGLSENSIETLNVGASIVSHNYFDVYDLEPIVGRLFRSTDTEDSEKICIVNQHFVNSYFANENPIGKRVRVLRPGTFAEVQNGSRTSPWTEWMVIKGVVPNIQPAPLPGATSQGYAEVYIPTKQWLSRGQTLLLRGGGNVYSYIEPVRKILKREAPQLAPVTKFQTVQDFLDQSNGSFSAVANIVTAFGIAALVMASVGIYALVSFIISQRDREFGIRVALGASPRDILLLVYRSLFLQIVLGLILGFALGVFLSNLLKGSMQMANLPVESTAYTIGMGIIIFCCIVSVFFPAIRAAKVGW